MTSSLAAVIVKTSTTVNGRTSIQKFDGLGRSTGTTSGYYTGSTLTTVSSTDIEYTPCACSPLGKVYRVSEPYAPGGTKYWTTYTYDALGRTISVAAPNSSGTTTYVYQGSQVTVTDPAGKWKTMEMDALGNLVTVTDLFSGCWYRAGLCGSTIFFERYWAVFE